MPLSEQKLPNVPLTGPELKQYTLQLLTDELEQRTVPDAFIVQVVNYLRVAMDNDYLFRAGMAYPLVVIRLTVRLHYCGDLFAVAMDPVFDIENQMEPRHTVFVRSPSPPLKERDGVECVECFTLTARVENPNAIRVHYKIPITMTRKKEPRPGEMFASFETETVDYDPMDVPAPDAPSVEDQSEEFIHLWGATGAKAGEHMEAPLPSGISPDAPDNNTQPHSNKRRKGWNKS